jgi:hypothetical protein
LKSTISFQKIPARRKWSQAELSRSPGIGVSRGVFGLKAVINALKTFHKTGSVPDHHSYLADINIR